MASRPKWNSDYGGSTTISCKWPIGTRTVGLFHPIEKLLNIYVLACRPTSATGAFSWEFQDVYAVWLTMRTKRKSGEMNGREISKHKKRHGWSKHPKCCIAVDILFHDLCEVWLQLVARWALCGGTKFTNSHYFTEQPLQQACTIILTW